MTLREYIVQGWVIDDLCPKRADGAVNRLPMRKVVIKAMTAKKALLQYVRSEQIPNHLWEDGTGTPPIVIRVSL